LAKTPPPGWEEQRHFLPAARGTGDAVTVDPNVSSISLLSFSEMGSPMFSPDSTDLEGETAPRKGGASRR
jgi:hypothetical protein